MAITEVQQIAPVQIGTGTPTVIGGITSLTVNTGTDTIREVTAGHTVPTLSEIATIRPTIQFSTTQLKQAIDAFGLAGFCFTTAGSNPIEAFMSQRDCAGNASGSTHDKYAATDGVVVPRTLRVDHQGNAQITYEAICITPDGTTAPVIKSTNLALPAAASESDKWTMGQFQLASTVIAAKRSINIDFGIALLQEGSDSEFYDSFTGIQQQLSRITIEAVKQDIFSGTIPLTGTVGTHANSHLYFKKRRTSDATAEHIQLTFACNAYMDNLVDATGAAAAMSSLILEPHFDGTNAAFVVDTAIAHP